MAARRAHNPEVAGSSPVPATKRLFRAVKDGSFYFTKALLNPLFSQIGKFCNLNKYFYWNILQYVLKILRQNFLPSLLDQSTKTSYEFIKRHKYYILEPNFSSVPIHIGKKICCRFNLLLLGIIWKIFIRTVLTNPKSDCILYKVCFRILRSFT